MRVFFLFLMMGVFWVSFPLQAQSNPTKTKSKVLVFVTIPEPWPAHLAEEINAAKDFLSPYYDLYLPSFSFPLTEDASRFFPQAEEALGRFDLDQALSIYDQALQTLERNGTMTLPLSELFVARASVFRLKEDTTKTKEELLRAAIVNPNIKIDPAKYPPSIVRLYNDALTEVQNGSFGFVTISASGANIFIDGRLYTGPLTIPHGEHFVRVEQEGFVSRAEKITVAESFLQLSYTLEKDSGILTEIRTAKQNSRENPLAICQWAKNHEFELALVLTETPSGIKATLADTIKNTTRKELYAVGRSVDTTIISLFTPLALDPKVEPPKKIIQNPAFWVPVGVSLVIGTTLLTVDIIQKKEGAKPTLEFSRELSQ